jgi:hypothetical protein
MRHLLTLAVLVCGMMWSAVPRRVEGADPLRRRSAAEVGLQFGPQTTVITAPLTDEGYPDYVEFLNRRRRAGVKPEENFWAAMWGAMGSVGRIPEARRKQLELRLEVRIPAEPQIRELTPIAARLGLSADLTEQMRTTSSRPWLPEEHPAIQRWLEENEALLAAVTTAARRPKASTPLFRLEGEPLVFQSLAHVDGARTVARMLACRSMRRIGAGDLDGAWSDLLTVIRIARHIQGGELLVEWHLAASVRGLAWAPLAEWLSVSPHPADELRRKWEELSEVAIPRPFHEAVESERYLYLDFLLRLKSGDLLLESWIGGKGNWAANQLVVSGMDINAVLARGNQTYDAVAAAMKAEQHALRLRDIETAVSPLHEADRRVGTDTDLVAAMARSIFQEPTTLLADFLAARFISFGVNNEEILTEDLARTAVAKGAFQLRIAVAEGRDLPAEGAGALPTDPFSDAPLKMARTGERTIIYSVGRNGRDDNGNGYGDRPDTDDIRLILTGP